MKWDGIDIPNGNPLKIGDNQIDKIMFGNDQVWINTVAPSAITNLTTFGGGLTASITITFTVATGIPTPTHDLYENGILIVSNITSGTVYNSTVKGNNSYYIRATNVAGHTDSNLSYASIWIGGNSLVVDSNTTLEPGIDVPIGLVTVCMIGGGGGGAQSYDPSWGTGGGVAGQNVGGTFTPVFGSNIFVTIGEGGSGQSGSGSGSPGTDTVLGSFFTASGGAGGQVISNNANATHNGNGGQQTTCKGTSNDGTQTTIWNGGGQGGFENGGNGVNGAVSGGHGGIGAGGGGATLSTWSGGRGGRGQVNLSW